MSNGKEHAGRVGWLIGQLQSVEFLLRWWLAKNEGLDVRLPRYAGEVLAETPFTDYRSLGALIASYNSQLKKDEAKFRVDEVIVDIRDALAHGRILAMEGEEHLVLFRFERPENGKVRTRAITALSEKQVADDIELAEMQYKRVLECGTQRGYFH